MTRSEANVSNDAALAISRAGGKSFRNNVGKAWSGKKIGEYTKNGKRYVVLENPRFIEFGLMKGSADRIGWVPTEITKDMVGQTFARFASWEIKTATGRSTKEQLRWHEAVSRDGGLSGFCRSADDAVRVCNGERLDA